MIALFRSISTSRAALKEPFIRQTFLARFEPFSFWREKHQAQMLKYVVLLATTPTLGFSLPTTEMLRVPGSRMRIGSTFEEMFQAAEFCNHLASRTACRATTFANETELQVDIGSFWMDRTEVSRRAYERCVLVGGCEPIPDRPENPDWPATMVSYWDAERYCTSLGKQLPTEAEFELAARGPTRRPFPWGTLLHRGHANGGDASLLGIDPADGFERLAPVHAFPSGATPLGHQQLAGNAAEWTRSSERVPEGHRVIKGGSYLSPAWELRSAARASALEGTRVPTLGFRCVRR